MNVLRREHWRHQFFSLLSTCLLLAACQGAATPPSGTANAGRATEPVATEPVATAASVNTPVTPDPVLTPSAESQPAVAPQDSSLVITPTATPTILPAVTPLPGITPLPAVVSILPTPTPAPAPASSPLAAGSFVTYTVTSGDSLYAIALRYDVAIEALAAANGLIDSVIYPDQVLIVPITQPVALSPTLMVESVPPAPVTAPSLVPDSAPAGAVDPGPYPFSPLYGDLMASYPASVDRARFTLRYAPERPPAGDLQAIADLVQRALDHHEQLLGVTLGGHFDIFAAGTLFEPPDQSLRGHAFSRDWRTVFLFDGSGNAADKQYLVAHELTHLFVWNVYGAAVSVMLSEGVAVYAGMELIADSSHMPIRTFCSAFHQAGALPRISQSLDYLGHIRNLENYYAAGCFVKFLIERYSAPAFGQLYPTADFVTVYGKSVEALEAEWIADLEANPVALDFAPGDLVTAVANLDADYSALFDNFAGTPEELATYWALDARRLAVLEGRLQSIQQAAAP